MSIRMPIINQAIAKYLGPFLKITNENVIEKKIKDGILHFSSNEVNFQNDALTRLGIPLKIINSKIKSTKVEFPIFHIGKAPINIIISDTFLDCELDWKSLNQHDVKSTSDILYSVEIEKNESKDSGFNPRRLISHKLFKDLHIRFENVHLRVIILSDRTKSVLGLHLDHFLIETDKSGVDSNIPPLRLDIKGFSIYHSIIPRDENLSDNFSSNYTNILNPLNVSLVVTHTDHQNAPYQNDVSFGIDSVQFNLNHKQILLFLSIFRDAKMHLRRYKYRTCSRPNIDNDEDNYHVEMWQYLNRGAILKKRPHIFVPRRALDFLNNRHQIVEKYIKLNPKMNPISRDLAKKEISNFLNPFPNDVKYLLNMYGSAYAEKQRRILDLTDEDMQTIKEIETEKSINPFLSFHIIMKIPNISCKIVGNDPKIYITPVIENFEVETYLKKEEKLVNFKIEGFYIDHQMGNMFSTVLETDFLNLNICLPRKEQSRLNVGVFGIYFTKEAQKFLDSFPEINWILPQENFEPQKYVNSTIGEFLTFLNPQTLLPLEISFDGINIMYDVDDIVIKSSLNFKLKNNFEKNGQRSQVSLNCFANIPILSVNDLVILENQPIELRSAGNLTIFYFMDEIENLIDMSNINMSLMHDTLKTINTAINKFKKKKEISKKDLQRMIEIKKKQVFTNSKLVINVQSIYVVFEKEFEIFIDSIVNNNNLMVDNIKVDHHHRPLFSIPGFVATAPYKIGRINFFVDLMFMDSIIRFISKVSYLVSNLMKSENPEIQEPNKESAPLSICVDNIGLMFNNDLIRLFEFKNTEVIFGKVWIFSFQSITINDVFENPFLSHESEEKFMEIKWGEEISINLSTLRIILYQCLIDEFLKLLPSDEGSSEGKSLGLPTMKINIDNLILSLPAANDRILIYPALTLSTGFSLDIGKEEKTISIKHSSLLFEVFRRFKYLPIFENFDASLKVTNDGYEIEFSDLFVNIGVRDINEALMIFKSYSSLYKPKQLDQTTSQKKHKIVIRVKAGKFVMSVFEDPRKTKFNLPLLKSTVNEFQFQMGHTPSFSIYCSIESYNPISGNWDTVLEPSKITAVITNQGDISSFQFICVEELNLYFSPVVINAIISLNHEMSNPIQLSTPTEPFEETFTIYNNLNQTISVAINDSSYLIRRRSYYVAPELNRKSIISILYDGKDHKICIDDLSFPIALSHGMALSLHSTHTGLNLEINSLLMLKNCTDKKIMVFDAKSKDKIFDLNKDQKCSISTEEQNYMLFIDCDSVEDLINSKTKLSSAKLEKKNNAKKITIYDKFGRPITHTLHTKHDFQRNSKILEIRPNVVFKSLYPHPFFIQVNKAEKVLLNTLEKVRFSSATTEKELKLACSWGGDNFFPEVLIPKISDKVVTIQIDTNEYIAAEIEMKNESIQKISFHSPCCIFNKTMKTISIDGIDIIPDAFTMYCPKGYENQVNIKVSFCEDFCYINGKAITEPTPLIVPRKNTNGISHIMNYSISRCKLPYSRTFSITFIPYCSVHNFLDRQISLIPYFNDDEIPNLDYSLTIPSHQSDILAYMPDTKEFYFAFYQYSTTPLISFNGQCKLVFQLCSRNQPKLYVQLEIRYNDPNIDACFSYAQFPAPIMISNQLDIPISIMQTSQDIMIQQQTTTILAFEEPFSFPSIYIQSPTFRCLFSLIDDIESVELGVYENKKVFAYFTMIGKESRMLNISYEPHELKKSASTLYLAWAHRINLSFIDHKLRELILVSIYKLGGKFEITDKHIFTHISCDNMLIQDQNPSASHPIVFQGTSNSSSNQRFLNFEAIMPVSAPLFTYFQVISIEIQPIYIKLDVGFAYDIFQYLWNLDYKKYNDGSIQPASTKTALSRSSIIYILWLEIQPIRIQVEIIRPTNRLFYYQFPRIAQTALELFKSFFSVSDIAINGSFLYNARGTSNYILKDLIREYKRSFYIQLKDCIKGNNILVGLIRYRWKINIEDYIELESLNMTKLVKSNDDIMYINRKTVYKYFNELSLKNIERTVLSKLEQAIVCLPNMFRDDAPDIYIHVLDSSEAVMAIFNILKADSEKVLLTQRTRHPIVCSMNSVGKSNDDVGIMMINIFESTSSYETKVRIYFQPNENTYLAFTDTTFYEIIQDPVEKFCNIILEYNYKDVEPIVSNNEFGFIKDGNKIKYACETKIAQKCYYFVKSQKNVLELFDKSLLL